MRHARIVHGPNGPLTLQIWEDDLPIDTTHRCSDFDIPEDQWCQPPEDEDRGDQR